MSKNDPKTQSGAGIRQKPRRLVIRQLVCLVSGTLASLEITLGLFEPTKCWTVRPHLTNRNSQFPRVGTCVFSFSARVSKSVNFVSHFLQDFPFLL